jgi:hypothetical protein
MQNKTFCGAKSFIIQKIIVPLCPQLIFYIKKVKNDEISCYDTGGDSVAFPNHSGKDLDL